MQTKTTIKSYDSHFDTFHVSVSQDGADPFETLIPAYLMPHVADELCDATEDLPYGLVGQSFVLKIRTI